MPPKKRTTRASAKKTKRPRSIIKKLFPETEKKPFEENSERKIEESKYLPSPSIQKFEEHRPFEFPSGYGDNRIVLMVRDPYWLYAYWEISQSKVNEISSELRDKFNSASLILRIYDTSDWNFFDVNIHGRTGNWYINVGRPNTSFCVDIGYLTKDGYFICAARSNIVTTPRDRMSDVIDEEWMIPDWEMMYALSGGFGMGKGSMEIKEMMEKRQWQAPSSWISSFGSPVKKPQARPFWLVANCELIVYGATEPTAHVTVQGMPIKLRPDGTFSMRFSLPDGKQTIPIEAVRDDGKESRKITPEVTRRTE